MHQIFLADEDVRERFSLISFYVMHKKFTQIQIISCEIEHIYDENVIVTKRDQSLTSVRLDRIIQSALKFLTLILMMLIQ